MKKCIFVKKKSTFSFNIRFFFFFVVAVVKLSVHVNTSLRS